MKKGFWVAAAAIGVVAGAAAAIYAMVKKDSCCCEDCCDCYEDDDLLDVDPSEYCKSSAPVEAEEEEAHFRTAEEKLAPTAPEHATVNDEEVETAESIDFDGPTEEEEPQQ